MDANDAGGEIYELRVEGLYARSNTLPPLQDTYKHPGRSAGTIDYLYERDWCIARLQGTASLLLKKHIVKFDRGEPSRRVRLTRASAACERASC
jgi:hypothetical protein